MFDRASCARTVFRVIIAPENSRCILRVIAMMGCAAHDVGLFEATVFAHRPKRSGERLVSGDNEVL